MRVSRIRAALAIVLFSTVAAVVYGIVHDMVTAHVCLEYFTVAHPRLFATDIPAVHALAWGVIATWWMGAALGVPLAIAALAGRASPPMGWRDLLRPVAVLLAVAGGAALIAGVAGYILAEVDFFRMASVWADQVPESRHSRFFFCAAAHMASYTVAGAGGLMLVMWTWKERQVRRWRAAATAQTSSERTSSA